VAPVQVGRVIRSAVEEGLDQIKRAGLDFASSVALGLGVFLLPAPLVLLWFIHADNERYEWLISGPPPFDQFGSGPFQLALILGFWTLAFGLLAIVLALRRRLVRGVWTRATIALLVLGIPPAALAFLGLAALLVG
jgi:hypothetical protein